MLIKNKAHGLSTMEKNPLLWSMNVGLNLPIWSLRFPVWMKPSKGVDIREKYSFFTLLDSLYFQECDIIVCVLVQSKLKLLLSCLLFLSDIVQTPKS